MLTPIERVACDFRSLLRNKRVEGFFDFFSDMSFLLRVLDQIRMVEGFNLYGCYKGLGWDAYGVELYASKPGEELQYTEEQIINKIPVSRSFWDIIFGRHPFRIERRMPLLVSSFEDHDSRLHSNYFDYMDIPFTEMGVWQAFLLRESHFFMPHVGGGIYSFIYCEDDYSDLIDGKENPELKELLLEEKDNPLLLPRVEVFDKEATVSFCFWSVSGGLFHRVIKAFYKPSGHIEINKSAYIHENLVPWNLGLRIN